MTLKTFPRIRPGAMVGSVYRISKTPRTLVGRQRCGFSGLVTNLTLLVDNVAMLALALHLWDMGYYVDKDGIVLDR